MRYLPSRGIAPRPNARLDATLQWLAESAGWRVYRGDYRDPVLGGIERSERAYVCARPLGGDEILLEEWKILSEHATVAEAYAAFDESLASGILPQEILARQFELSVTDQFGVGLLRPG